MIPKIIHFYWAGGRLSYLQYLSIVSFRKHNPLWKVWLWTPKTPSNIKPTWESEEHKDEYKGKDYLAITKKLCEVMEVDIEDNLHEVQRSDYIRWKILYDNGGVWSDIDILYLKPIDSVIGDYDCTICYDGHHHLIGFYITKPEQKIYLDIFNEAKSRLLNPFSNDYQFIGSRMVKSELIGNMRTGGYNAKVFNIPMDIVYPYTSDPKDIEELLFGSQDKTTENTIGIHWYNGSPLAKKYLNNFEKYKDNGSVISREVACFL